MPLLTPVPSIIHCNRLGSLRMILANFVHFFTSLPLGNAIRIALPFGQYVFSIFALSNFFQLESQIPPYSTSLKTYSVALLLIWSSACTISSQLTWPVIIISVVCAPRNTIEKLCSEFKLRQFFSCFCFVGLLISGVTTYAFYISSHQSLFRMSKSTFKFQSRLTSLNQINRTYINRSWITIIHQTLFANPGMELPIMMLRTFNNIDLNIDKWTHMLLDQRNKVNRSSENFNTLCCIFPFLNRFVLFCWKDSTGINRATVLLVYVSYLFQKWDTLRTTMEEEIGKRNLQN